MSGSSVVCNGYVILSVVELSAPTFEFPGSGVVCFIAGSVGTGGVRVGGRVGGLVFDHSFGGVVLPFLSSLVVTGIPTCVSSMCVNAAVGEVAVVNVALGLGFSVWSLVSVSWGCYTLLSELSWCSIFSAVCLAITVLC